jgi:anti-sigma-K factor RskA
MSRPEREAHTLAGPYAMDAISEPDRVRFERHLAGCEECRQEVAGLREATARLAAATAVSPPPAMKERVMAAVAATRQQPPPAQPQAASRPWPARRRVRIRVRLALAAAAVAVGGVAVLLGVSNGSMQDQLNRDQASSQQVATVLTARDATMKTGAVRGGGTVTIVMSRSMRELVFTAADLRALPAAWGYELWLAGPAGDRPVTMLAAARHGMAGPVIASGLRPGDHLVLTAEPSGGAARPTTPMMLDVVL